MLLLEPVMIKNLIMQIAILRFYRGNYAYDYFCFYVISAARNNS